MLCVPRVSVSTMLEKRDMEIHNHGAWRLGVTDNACGAGAMLVRWINGPFVKSYRDGMVVSYGSSKLRWHFLWQPYHPVRLS